MRQLTIVARTEPFGYVPEEPNLSQRKFADNIVLRRLILERGFCKCLDPSVRSGCRSYRIGLVVFDVSGSGPARSSSIVCSLPSQ